MHRQRKTNGGPEAAVCCFGLSAVERQLKPPNSQISKMIGRGIPSSQRSSPRPISASKDFVAG
jgi:hypothetical protein